MVMNVSFDGILLEKLNKEIEFLKTGRISKINENGDTDFIFTIRKDRINYQLMLSFSSDYSRIHLTKHIYDSVLNPKSFTMLLRKHIEGYFIDDIINYECDRILYFKLSGYNELSDLNHKYLICEVMGRYSNLILTDENFIIIDALKHDGIGEYNRTILPNAKYEFPLNNKINPMKCSKDEIIDIFLKNNPKNPKELMNLFNGVSLNIAYPVFQNDFHAETFYKYLHLDNKPATYKNFKDKIDFYYYPLEGNIIKEYDSISSMLDDYYYQMDLRAKVKLKTNDLQTFVKRQITKFENKIEKLEAQLLDTSSADTFKLYGELLLSYPNIKEKKSEISILNYYTNEYIDIKLDPKFTILENSNKFYKKYQKLKSSVTYINEQMEIAKNEIEYFKVIDYQLKDATINDALEIQAELINGKYLFKNTPNKNKKKEKPKLLTYISDNGTCITVGKNNIQNEYLTHKLAKPNEMWFHIKDAPGSHVVVHNSHELTEEEIRTGAMLAAYYSTYQDSSSVQVDYTRIRNIKKIPGKRACFVTYTHQQTIYIDPDSDFIYKLKVKK